MKKVKIREVVILFLIILTVSSFLFMHIALADELSDSITEMTEILMYNITNKTFVVYKHLFAKDVCLTAFGYSVVLSIFISLMYLSRDRKDLSEKGQEHGSARWATKKEITVAMEQHSDNNIIVSKNAQLSLDGEKYKRNKNVTVIGGSGAGKSYNFVIPNIMQMNSDYLVTDPKGEILRKTGTMLKENGYEIRVLNLVEMDKSDYFNLFSYIDKTKQQEVISMIDLIMKNTNDGEKSKDPFWDSAEVLLMTAMVFYVLEKGGDDEVNIGTMMYLINLIDLNIEDGEKDVVDLLFEDFEKEYGSEHIAVMNFKSFRNAGSKNQGSILLTNSSRLSLFNVNEVKRLMKYDTLELDKMGEGKRAIFIIVSPADKTFSFIAGLLYTQLFKVLDFKANRVYGGSLPNTVMFYLDEFANTGKFPDFEMVLAYARSLNIGLVPIFQSMSQMITMFGKDEYEKILDNCDTLLILSAKGKTTTEYISSILGKKTIDTVNKNKSFGQQRSTSLNDSIMGRELMTPDEIVRMDINKCIIFIRGIRPYFDNKYNPKKHKNYKLLGFNGEDRKYVHIPKQVEEYAEVSIDIEPSVDVPVANESSNKAVDENQSTQYKPDFYEEDLYLEESVEDYIHQEFEDDIASMMEIGDIKEMLDED